VVLADTISPAAQNRQGIPFVAHDHGRIKTVEHHIYLAALQPAYQRVHIGRDLDFADPDALLTQIRRQIIGQRLHPTDRSLRVVRDFGQHDLTLAGRGDGGGRFLFFRGRFFVVVITRGQQGDDNEQKENQYLA
jgi:hypothetical protein